MGRKDAMARAKTKVRKSSGVAEGAGEEGPPHKKLNTGGGDSATDAAAAGKDDDAGALTSMTEMLAEIAALKKVVETWKGIFKEELGLSPGAGAGEEEEDDINDPESLGVREKIIAMKKDKDVLTASLLDSQAKLNTLRKEMALTAATVSPQNQKISKTLIDPGLARQFRHMESEVEQGRDMMKEMQDELVAVTYSPESFEHKQQVDKLHKLEKENEGLKAALSATNVTSLQNEVSSLKKQVQEVETQYKGLQEYT